MDKEAMLAEADKARVQNIIGLSLGFTAMLRLFERGSARKIASMIAAVLENLRDSPDTFDAVHERFCTSFVKGIRLNPLLRKGGRRPSYGQAAKVLDVALKACVYYCRLPDPRSADKLSQTLRVAIDTPFLMYLKRRYPKVKIQARAIADIDRRVYFLLQAKAMEDARSRFGTGALAVQYDDILWRQLNRASTSMK